MTDKDKTKDQKPEDTNKEETQEEEKEILPPLDFSSLVLPFFTQALIKLGQLSQGDTADQEGKLNLAKRLIDLLDMLKSRTQGNLKPEEQIFLDQCLHQLRMAYMEQAKIISL
ncbi:DUF1844 domain-containing protein [Acidobacteriota bacterium]